jgi:hypothetical protein
MKSSRMTEATESNSCMELAELEPQLMACQVLQDSEENSTQLCLAKLFWRILLKKKIPQLLVRCSPLVHYPSSSGRVVIRTVVASMELIRLTLLNYLSLRRTQLAWRHWDLLNSCIIQRVDLQVVPVSSLEVTMTQEVNTEVKAYVLKNKPIINWK